MANDKKVTDAEAKFFFSILLHMKSKADVDWEAVTEDMGFKNVDVAKTRFGQVKRKFSAAGDATSSPKGAGSPPSKVGKASGRAGKKGKAAGGTPKRIKKEACRDEEEEEVPEGEGSFIKMEAGEAGVGGDSVMNDTDPF